MAYTPFTKDDQPTMQAFNEKFQQTIDEALRLGIKVKAGSYTGTGTASATIKVGFPLIAVIVETYDGIRSGVGGDNPFGGLAVLGSDATFITISGDSFIIKSQTGTFTVGTNVSSIRYNYLAIGYEEVT